MRHSLPSTALKQKEVAENDSGHGLLTAVKLPERIKAQRCEGTKRAILGVLGFCSAGQNRGDCR